MSRNLPVPDSDYTLIDEEANPFLDEEDDDIIIEPDYKNDLPDSKHNTSRESALPETTQASGEGFFGFNNFATPFAANQAVQIDERQFTGGSTLDERVFTTIRRDVDKIGEKLLSTLWPLKLRSKFNEVQQRFGVNLGAATEEGMMEEAADPIAKVLDWDLWGPLLLILAFSLVITYLQTRNLTDSTSVGSSEIFSGSFTLIWASFAVLSWNLQLLSPNKNLSFFQGVSILGYSIFPIILGGVFAIFVKWKLVRLPLQLIMILWSSYCVYLILKIINNSGINHGEGDDRLGLIIGPIVLVFSVLSWLCITS